MHRCSVQSLRDSEANIIPVYMPLGCGVFFLGGGGGGSRFVFAHVLIFVIVKSGESILKHLFQT